MTGLKDSDRNSVVACYASLSQSEVAIRDLRKHGFNLTKLSIVSRDLHRDEHVIGFYSSAGVLQNAAIVEEAGALAVALTAIGVPVIHLAQWAASLEAGTSLLILHGAARDIEHAKERLDKTQPTAIESYIANAGK